MEVRDSRPRFYCDVAPALHQMADDLAAKLDDSAGVTIDFSNPAQLKATFDLGAVTSAVRELVTNALTYAPAASRIAIEGRVDGSSLVITVRDNQPTGSIAEWRADGLGQRNPAPT